MAASFVQGRARHYVTFAASPAPYFYILARRAVTVVTLPPATPPTPTPPTPTPSPSGEWAVVHSPMTRSHTAAASAYTSLHAASHARALSTPRSASARITPATRPHAATSSGDHPVHGRPPAFVYSVKASLDSFCDKMRLSPSANLQHCRKSVWPKPVPSSGRGKRPEPKAASRVPRHQASSITMHDHVSSLTTRRAPRRRLGTYVRVHAAVVRFIKPSQNQMTKQR